MGPKIATLDSLKNVRRRSGSVPIYTDPDLRAKFLVAKQRHQRMVDDYNGVYDADQEAAALGEKEALETELEESVVLVKLRSISSYAYEELVAAHPPRSEDHQHSQDQGAGAKAHYNLDTFPAALLAACSDEPKFSVAEAEMVLRDSSREVAQELFTMALYICSEASGDVLGKGSWPTLL